MLSLFVNAQNMHSAEPNCSPQLLDIIIPQRMYMARGTGTRCLIMINNMFVDDG